MADSKILLQEIKNLVSIRDIYDRYVGLPPDSSHRFQCPFNHDEDRKNFVINSKMWHCFSCGCSGDQVTLVQKVFDLSFTDALTKITYDFNLQVGDYNELSVRARIESQRRLLQREKDRRYAKLIDVNRKMACRYLFERQKLLECLIEETNPNEDNVKIYAYTNDCVSNMIYRKHLQRINLYLDILSEMPVEDEFDFEYPAFSREERHNLAIKFIQKIIDIKAQK